VHADPIVLVPVLLAIVALGTAAAKRIGMPYPILLVITGLLVGFVPGVPRVELEPEVVLLLFLPPILFSAAYLSSPRELWRHMRPISLLAFGLVLATTAGVAVVAVSLIPGLGWPAAIALGAVVSPPDAIAVTAIAQRLGLPSRLVTILEGESLLNDATALVTYRFAVAAIGTTVAVSPLSIASSFLVVAAGGVLVGVVVGLLVSWLLATLDDPPVEVLISLLAPLTAYLPAESVGVSGVLAVVTAGLVHGWKGPKVISEETGAVGLPTWQMVTFVVNGLAFLLIGLQLPGVLEEVSGRPPGQLIGLAVAIVATVIVVRLAWVFPATYLPRWLSASLADRDPAPPPRVVLVMGWAGMRGAVSLAAALALPASVPERDLLVFLAFVVILATLVGQGLTLPILISRLRIGESTTADRKRIA
jgi:monovalent cation/hydrogen antiporter